MTRARKVAGPAGVVALATLALSACAGPSPAAAPSPRPDTRATSTASEASPTAGSTSSEQPDGPGGLETPATRAGSLSRRSFPRPRALGAGWAYAVDPGDAEEGYLGNGTPALERDPREIVQLAVPFGCARPARMPAATHVLEVDYTANGVRVIAIRGEFAHASTAEAFYAGRAANLDRCRGRSGGQAIGTLVARTDRLRDGVLLSDRTPRSDPWSELAVLDGDQVVLVAARTSLGRPPMTRVGARRLAALFQR